MDMDLRHFIIEYLSPLLEQVVHGSVDQGFVARDGAGGKDYRVSRDDVNLAMVSISHTDQS
ncbi:hypothetical protein ES703_80942 [subsurface metagenome]